MDLSLLLDWNYLTDPRPAGDFVFGFLALVWFGGLLCAKQFLSSKMKTDKHFRKSIKKKLWKFPLVGALGLIFVLARFGGVAGMSMRLLLLIVGLISLVLLVWTIVTVRRDYRMRIESVEREKNR